MFMDLRTCPTQYIVDYSEYGGQVNAICVYDCRKKAEVEITLHFSPRNRGFQKRSGMYTFDQGVEVYKDMMAKR